MLQHHTSTILQGSEVTIASRGRDQSIPPSYTMAPKKPVLMFDFNDDEVSMLSGERFIHHQHIPLGDWSIGAGLSAHLDQETA